MVRIDDSAAVMKCWLNRAEVARLEDAAARTDRQREIALQLMARCGFRADEVTYPGDAELRWNEEADGYLVEDRGKNIGGDPKIGDAWVPEPVQANLRLFARERGRETGGPWVQVSTSTVGR